VEKKKKKEREELFNSKFNLFWRNVIFLTTVDYISASAWHAFKKKIYEHSSPFTLKRQSHEWSNKADRAGWQLEKAQRLPMRSSWSYRGIEPAILTVS